MKMTRMLGLMVVGGLWLGRLFGDEPATTIATGADFPPEFRGMLVLKQERRFALSTPGGTESAWVLPGGSFNGWQVVEYREPEEVLVVSKEGVTVDLTLAESHILETSVAQQQRAIAQAEDLMRRMHFEEMFAGVIEQQKKTAVTAMRQMMGSDKNMPARAAEDMAAFQARVMETLWAEIDPKQMEAEMARAYAEVFTPVELQAMAEFYSTPAGQATIEKAPAVQERVMQTLMPRLMAAMPKIREMSRQFAEEMKLKQQQADEGRVAPVTPATAPADKP